FHLHKEVTKSLKKAKKFLSLKMIRQLKELKLKDTENQNCMNAQISKITQEIETLKKINLPCIAKSELIEILTNSELPEKELCLNAVKNFNSSECIESDGNIHKSLIEKLIKQKCVQDELNSCLKDLIFLITGKGEKKPKKERIRKKDFQVLDNDELLAKISKIKVSSNTSNIAAQNIADVNKAGIKKNNSEKVLEIDLKTFEPNNANEKKLIDSSEIDYSDFENYSDVDDEADIEAEPEVPKKNRKGQRERRVEWEKKYGKSAKHLLKIEQKKQELESLHPSWKAKKAQAPVIKDFVGKKITFGDDVTEESFTVQNTNNNHSIKLPANGKNIISQPKIVENLHPSWQAKKSQNLGIVSFTGSKITFDDDDDIKADDESKTTAISNKRSFHQIEDNKSKIKKVVKKRGIVTEFKGKKIKF
ncbi:hypothetical protein HK099_006258, partial [Clydaea vesicula]